MLSVRAETTLSIRDANPCRKPTLSAIEVLLESFFRDYLRARPRRDP